MEKAFEIADSLEKAQDFSRSYGQTQLNMPPVSAVSAESDDSYIEQSSIKKKDCCHSMINPVIPRQANLPQTMCMFCGRKHPFDRSKCPARNVTCHDCGKRGHFRKVCRSSQKASKPVASLTEAPFSSLLASSGHLLENAMVTVEIRKFKLEALVDSEAVENYIDSRVANELRLKITGPRT